MNHPLVSILVPAYNGERFLRPALRSALEQSYKNIEVVVADDASTDGTAQILASFEAADPRMRVIRNETNLGGPGNVTRLLEVARGEYVKFLLHDDVLATDCVRDLLRGLEDTPGAMLAFSRRVLIDENGRTRPDGDLKALMDHPGALDGRELGDAILESNTNVIGELTTVLFRRSDIDLHGLWQIDGRALDVLEDVWLFLTLLARGPAFYSPRALSRFRIHSGQNTRRPWIGARGVRDWTRLIDWGARNGFLTDPQQERRAHARSLQVAAARVAERIAGQDHGPALEAVFLSTARLVELDARLPVDRARGLQERSHGSAVLDRFAQELDVWSHEFPVALAAPSLDPAEIRSTVAAFRDLRESGIAARLLLAVPPPSVEEAVPLVEAALAEGTDIPVEQVPTDAPATLLTGPWLAVVPRGGTWHDTRALATWTFDVPSVSDHAGAAGRGGPVCHAAAAPRARE